MINAIKPRRFAIAWMVAGTLVVPLSFVAALPTIVGIAHLHEFLLPASSYDFWEHRSYIVAATYGIMNGFLIGLLQKAIVGRYLHVELPRWVYYSTFGGLIAGAVTWFALDASRALYDLLRDWGAAPAMASALEIGIPAMLYLCALASVQALPLSRVAGGVWRWIGAHALAIVLALGIEFALASSPGGYHDSGISALIALPLAAVMTAIAMRALLRPRLGAGKRTA